MLDSDSAIDTQQTTAENIVLINLIDFSLLIFCIQNVRIVCWWIYRWLTIITEDHKATYLHDDGYLHWTKKNQHSLEASLSITRERSLALPQISGLLFGFCSVFLFNSYYRPFLFLDIPLRYAK